MTKQDVCCIIKTVDRENNTQEFDNWVGDYTEAETKEEAIELVKQWLIDNGYTDDVEELEFNVEEVEQN